MSKKTETNQGLPAAIDPKNATEAATWQALPAAGANDDGGPTVAEMATALGLSASQAGKMLKTLTDKGLAVATKSGRALRYARAALAEPVTTEAAHDTPREAKARKDRARLAERGLTPPPPPNVETLMDPAPSVPAQRAAEPAADPGVAEGVQMPSSDVSEALAAMEDGVQVAPAVPVPLGVAVGTAQRLSEAEAREVTSQIKGKLTDLVPLVLRAHEGRADLALGYANWAAYCEAELFGVRVPVMQRQQAVRVLSASMSTRAVAGALGISEGTVRRDLEATGGALTQGALAGLDGKVYDRAKAPKKTAAKVVAGSAEGDAPAPVTATETGTCINCRWAILRRIDKAGAPWTHKDGDRVCKDMPGHFAEPVVQDVEPADVDIVTDSADVNAAIAAMTEPAMTEPAAPVTVASADGSMVIAGGATVDVPLPEADASPSPAPGVDVSDIVLAIIGFEWDAYEMENVPRPMPKSMEATDTPPEWLMDLAEHIANTIGR